MQKGGKAESVGKFKWGKRKTWKARRSSTMLEAGEAEEAEEGSEPEKRKAWEKISGESGRYGKHEGVGEGGQSWK